MKKLYWIIVLTSIALSGCGDDRLATVDGKAITPQAFEAYLKFKRINPRDDIQRNKLLDQYLEREALAAAAAKANVLDPDLIEAELNEFKKEMLISRYFETFLKDQVSDQAIENYYKASEQQYSERKAHVRHILQRLTPNMTETERKAKLTTAQEAHGKLKAGKDFAQIAKDYSEDAISAKKGGDLGWLKEGSIHKVFSDAAFALKPGEYSEPVETPFGYHLIQLVEGPSTVTRPFEAVQGDIRYQLRNQTKDAELKRLSTTVKVSKEKGL